MKRIQFLLGILLFVTINIEASYYNVEGIFRDFEDIPYDVHGYMIINKGDTRDYGRDIAFDYDIPYYDFYIDNKVYTGNGGITSFYYGYEGADFTCKADPFWLDGDIGFNMVNYSIDFYSENGIPYNSEGYPSKLYNKAPYAIVLEHASFGGATNGPFGYADKLFITRVASAVPEDSALILIVTGLMLVAFSVKTKLGRTILGFVN